MDDERFELEISNDGKSALLFMKNDALCDVTIGGTTHDEVCLVLGRNGMAELIRQATKVLSQMEIPKIV